MLNKCPVGAYGVSFAQGGEAELENEGQTRSEVETDGVAFVEIFEHEVPDLRGGVEEEELESGTGDGVFVATSVDHTGLQQQVGDVGTHFVRLSVSLNHVLSI